MKKSELWEHVIPNPRPATAIPSAHLEPGLAAVSCARSIAAINILSGKNWDGGRGGGTIGSGKPSLGQQTGELLCD
jgi:hypothetical protein